MAENRSRLKTGKSPSRSATRSKLGSIKRATTGMRERKARESLKNYLKDKDRGTKKVVGVKGLGFEQKLAMYPSIYAKTSPVRKGRSQLATTQMESTPAASTRYSTLKRLGGVSKRSKEGAPMSLASARKKTQELAKRTHDYERDYKPASYKRKQAVRTRGRSRLNR